MRAEELNEIIEEIKWQKDIASKILNGNRDNYDGADGARYIMILCKYIEELVKEVKVD